MGKIIAVYDVTGIQEYIFASNKLKENIGASIIVQKLFEEYLVESIKDKRVETDWQNLTELKILTKDIDVEVLYIGGGNAWVAFRDKDVMKEVNKTFSKIIIDKTNGQIGVAVAYLETDFSDYNSDKKELFKKLKAKKNSMSRQSPMMGIGITREGITDGLPAACKDNEDYISKLAMLKREEGKSEYFEEKLMISKGERKFPKEIDFIGQEDEKSYIAVVHIDGNNMGKMIDKGLKEAKDYSEAIITMREFSKQIDKSFKDTMYDLILDIENSIINGNLKENKSLKKGIIPIRPVVLNGDDVTFICDGRYGIHLAEQFLNKLKDKKIEINNNKIKLSACAGVAIVKTKFPFYRAYELAEKLCTNAKLKGKILAEKKSENMGNWIDFHILTTGIVDDLQEYRSKIYNLEGLDKASVLYAGNKEMLQHNLLCRPYIIGDDKIEEYKIEILRKIYDELKNKPHSKIKELRNKFFSTKAELDEYIKILKSRGKENEEIIPKVGECGIDNLFNSNITPYFDAIELEYFYETL